MVEESVQRMAIDFKGGSFPQKCHSVCGLLLRTLSRRLCRKFLTGPDRTDLWTQLCCEFGEDLEW